MCGRNKQYTDEMLLNILDNLYHNWGDTLSDTVNKCDDIPSKYTYISRFGGLVEAREKINVDSYKFKKNEKIEEHYRNLRDIEREKGFVESDDIKYHLFDDKSIDEIRDAAGLNFTTEISNRGEVYMIEELRSIDGDIISTNDINEKTPFSPNQYTYTFGSMDRALTLAGKYNNNHNSDFWYAVTGIPNPEEVVVSIDGYNKSKSYYVYRVHFEESFYVGMTNNITRRMSKASTRSPSRWPDDSPIDIDIESFDMVDAANEREHELTLETAIEFDTNNVYGGHHKYRNGKNNI